MKGFDEYNPIAVIIWFLCVTGCAMFFRHPVFVIISLFSSVLMFLVRNGRNNARSHIYFFLLFLVLAAANFLLTHNGKTVLFVLNNNPVTLEALLYGINSAAMIASLLYWFSSFSSIMTSDKIMYATSALSPKLALVISMTLRYIPLLKRQAEKISNAQKAAGLYSEDNIIDEIRGRSEVFSILVTWALENGITTADSMDARGYGSCRRTCFKQYRFHREDVILVTVSVILSAFTVISALAGNADFEFYPEIKYTIPDSLAAAGNAAFFVLTVIPVFIEMKVRIKWKYLLSEI